MRLTTLLSFYGISQKIDTDFEVKGISASSSDIHEGYIFVAVKGLKKDGSDFIDEAVSKGARAILTDRPLKADVPVIVVEDIRHTLAVFSTVIYPSGDIHKMGVTGTNGKTSTVFFVQQLLNKQEEITASIGTIGIESPVYHSVGSMTTPDSVTLNRSFMMLQEKGIQTVVLEASSHGLDQKRLDGIEFDVTGFTNLTRDHLDYHETMEAYLKAKMRLFLERTKANGIVVLNADIPEYKEMAAACQKQGLRVYSYGINGDTLKLLSQKPTEFGQEITIEIQGKQYDVTLGIYGDFQVMNILCAVGMCLARGKKADDLIPFLSTLEAPAGRMDLVGSINGAQIFVDYAHTPDALERVLISLRPHTRHRLVCLFGCGGNRDTGKRPQMGSIAEKLADVVYITDDNPRFESPEDIRAAIKGSCPKGIEADGRFAAIYESIHSLEAGDILVLCGKGHETGQMVEDVSYLFNDKMQVQVVLAGMTQDVLWKSTELSMALNTTVCPYIHVCGISIDTRTIQTGDLFVALKGVNIDGHAYVPMAIEKGAAACLVDHLIEGIPVSQQIVVDDTQSGLEALARFSRMRSEAVFIGITGSSGKTTTKEMLKACLEKQGSVFATIGNLNNQIGVPLTLARLPLSAEYAIIEMGMNHTGEMEELSDLVRPNVTMITMIGAAHREFFKSDAEIAAAKAEIFVWQDKGGVAILNKESPFFLYLMGQAHLNKIKRVVSFGEAIGADFKLLGCVVSAGKTQVDMEWHGSVYSYELGFSGRHFALNSLGVLAIVDAVGASVEQAMGTLAEVRPVQGRGASFEVRLSEGRLVTIIDDAYNANPSSVEASIHSLGVYQKGRRIAVLGDMLELGEEGLAMHQALAPVLIENKIDKVYTVGSLMKSLYDILPPSMQGGYTDTASEMLPLLLQKVQSEDTVLIKASKGTKLSQIITAFKGENK